MKINGLTLIYGNDSLAAKTFVGQAFNTLFNSGKYKAYPGYATGVEFLKTQFLKVHRKNKNKFVFVFTHAEALLHPSEQIEMAKYMCKLIHSGFKFIVLSHSPYFIHALEVYLSRYYTIDEYKKVFSAYKVIDSDRAEKIAYDDIDEVIFGELHSPLKTLNTIQKFPKEEKEWKRQKSSQS